MDPFTAIGLVAAIITFVDLGVKLFSHPAGTDDGLGSKTAKMVAEDVVKSMDAIRASRVLASIRGSGDWHEYEPFLTECTAISNEILQALDKMPDGTRRGRFHVSSFKKAFVGNRSGKHVENLLNRLHIVRAAVNAKLHLALSLDSHETLKAVYTNTCSMMRQINELKLERRPKELGYTWETGSPKDHIWVDDGLDPPFLLPQSLRQSLVEVLQVKYTSNKLPGRFQIANRHIMIWNWEETQSLPMDDGCVTLPEDWHRIKLAFALASPWGGTARKCIRCRKPQLHRDFGKFDTCKSCKLSFRAIDPTAFRCELQDMLEYNLHDMHRDYLVASRSKQGTTTSPNPTAASTKPASSADGLSEAQLAKLRDDPQIELVCRRIVIKWEPFFNIVHRYMYCRCILRKTSPASCEKEMTFLISPFHAVCPRHNNEDVTFRDYGDDDYHMDPYFDRFGGYDMFRFLALICAKGDLDSLLGREAFISDEDFRREEERYFGLSEQEKTYLHEAMIQYYFLESWDTLDRMKVPLPPYAVEKLQEKRLLRGAKHPDPIGGDADSEIRARLYDSPMSREVREICAGTWSGKLHWAVEE